MGCAGPVCTMRDCCVPKPDTCGAKRWESTDGGRKYPTGVCAFADPESDVITRDLPETDPITLDLDIPRRKKEPHINEELIFSGWADKKLTDSSRKCSGGECTRENCCRPGACVANYEECDLGGDCGYFNCGCPKGYEQDVPIHRDGEPPEYWNTFKCKKTKTVDAN